MCFDFLIVIADSKHVLIENRVTYLNQNFDKIEQLQIHNMKLVG